MGDLTMAKTCKFVQEYKEKMQNIKLNFDNCKPPKHTMKRLVRLLKKIKDIRVAGMIDYPLEEIIVITFLAVLANASTWNEISKFGIVHKKWLGKFLKLEHGIPSHDTFERVFGLIDSKELQSVTVMFLIENIDNIRKAMNTAEGQKRQICIDGKEANGTGKKHGTKEEIRNLQTLHVYDTSYAICLHSEIIDKKTNEIPVAQDILKKMNLNNVVCTFDALNTQKKTIDIIVEQKGDYVGALKGNHAIFESEVATLFSEKFKKDIRDSNLNYIINSEKAHNKIETRRFYLTTDVEWFTELGEWKNLKSFICYEKTFFDIVTKKETFEVRYYIASLTDIELCADAIRGHWGVENGLHWHLDANFYEDDNSTMNKTAFNNLSILNKMILSLMKLSQPIFGKDSIKCLRKVYAWTIKDELSKILNAFDSKILLESLSVVYSK
jgi:predicted transposase YbfD/YdcC